MLWVFSHGDDEMNLQIFISYYICAIQAFHEDGKHLHASYIFYMHISKFADIFTKTVNFNFHMDDKTKWQTPLSTRPIKSLQ